MHIIGTKAKAAAALEEAVSNGAATDSVAPDSGDASAASQPVQSAEAAKDEVGNGEAARPPADVNGTQSCPASEAAADHATDFSAGEEPSALAAVQTEAALDTATVAADVLHVEDIWDFKRRQATWHSLI